MSRSAKTPSAETPWTPPPVAASAVRMFTPGGLGEVGRNMMVLEHGGQSMVIDCGVLFPSEHTPGVDLILPDFSLLTQAGVSPSHVLLTHGHEDHIGALPYLLREYPDLVLVGSRLTLALVRAKLTEHRLTPSMIEIEGGDERDFDLFNVRAYRVHHSVPDGLAYAVRVGGSLFFHTGDFKLDPMPLDNRPTDLAGFGAVSVEGVDVLFSDSTNADVNGTLSGERELWPVFRSMFEQAEGRVIFACFASNVHRVQQVIDATVAAGRKFVFVGRSMIRNMGIAAELGYLNIEDGAEVTLKEAAELPAEKLVMISTGSQGEPLSALARMARSEHQIKLRSSDLVILSARLIPGNETDIFKVVNDLSRRGITVLHRENSPVHASGHAAAGELAQVLALMKPRYFVPVHGEWRHLRAHANLAYKLGMDTDHVLLMSNGDVLDYERGQEPAARIAGSYPFSEVYVDGRTVGLVSARTLKERRQLGESGVVNVTVAVHENSGLMVAPASIEPRGLPSGGFDELEWRTLISEEVAGWASSLSRDPDTLSRAISQRVRRLLKQGHGLEPLVNVVVMKVALPAVDQSVRQPGVA